MQYIKIINWEEFQHYKDRDPPWIKLHNRLLRNYEFSCLQDASKLLLILLWLVRSMSDGDIPYDPAHIKRLTAYEGEIDLKPLIEQGFIECYQDASKPLAICAPETEKRRDREEKRENNACNDKKYTLEHIQNTGFLIGLSDDQCEAFYHRYGRQGWVFDNGRPIVDLSHALTWWKNNSHKFPKKELTDDDIVKIVART